MRRLEKRSSTASLQRIRAGLRDLLSPEPSGAVQAEAGASSTREEKGQKTEDARRPWRAKERRAELWLGEIQAGPGACAHRDGPRPHAQGQHRTMSATMETTHRQN
jgi:hypothetical protein